MEKNFEEFKKILTNGNADEILAAKNEIDKLWRNDKTWFKRNKRAYFLMLENLAEAGDEKTQARLISSFDLFVLAFGEENFDYLVDYFLEKMQSKNGYLRRAALKSFRWFNIHFLNKTHPSFIKKSCDWNVFKKEKEKANLKYNFILNKIRLLIKKYEVKKNEKGVTDARNKAGREILTRALEEIMRLDDEFSESSFKRDELIFKQREVEEKIKEIIRRHKLKISYNDIWQFVYNENGNGAKSFHRFLDILFSSVPRSEELTDEEIQLIGDAWNYLPHGCLGGKCPVEVIQESLDKQPNQAKNPLPPIWQEMDDEPDVSLSFEDGKLVLGGAEGNDFFDDKNFIGTEAGGKNGKLRFYFIFTPARELKFSKSRAIIFGLAAKEISGQYDCDLEEIEIEDDYALITILIPFDVAPGMFGDKMLKTIGKGKEKIIRNHYYSGNVSKSRLGGTIKEYLDYLKKENIE